MNINEFWPAFLNENFPARNATNILFHNLSFLRKTKMPAMINEVLTLSNLDGKIMKKSVDGLQLCHWLVRAKQQNIPTGFVVHPCINEVVFSC